jgi:hypothetical protein
MILLACRGFTQLGRLRTIVFSVGHSRLDGQGAPILTFWSSF